DAVLDGTKLGDALYNQALNGLYTVIRNNRFQSFRGRGILLKAHHALIEGNVFDYVSNQAIILHNNQDVPEGLLNRSVVIRGNVIRNGGRDANFTRPDAAAGISVLFGTGVGTVARDRGHRQIVIEDNRFEQWRRTAIAVYGA